MPKRIKSANKVVAPSFFNKPHDCVLCGGRFKVTRSSQIFISEVGRNDASGACHQYPSAKCPYCGRVNFLDADPHEQFRNKLNAFIVSQVSPIKSIEDVNVRLPMQKLLDDFNALVQED